MSLVDGREEGFITSKGRFVSREEASKIAFKAGQIPEDDGHLSSQVFYYYSEKD